MKVVFSRKGFDSASGGVPSPIVEERPISIPIPTRQRSETTYEQLGLGDIVSRITKKRLTGRSLCHHDPMFEGDRCAFGQTAAAQSHLANNSVGVGDVFLFFGLFSEMNGKDRHHRIFGFLQVEEVVCLGSNPSVNDQPTGFENRHPHTIGEWNANNTIYVGPGQITTACKNSLRLTKIGENVSLWKVPSWLRKCGLTYHGKQSRWGNDDTLQVVGRGQEFVTDITDNVEANGWLNKIIGDIRDV